MRLKAILHYNFKALLGYGRTCGRGNYETNGNAATDGTTATYDGFETLCAGHDHDTNKNVAIYQDQVLKADRGFLHDLLFGLASPRVHLVDVAFSGQPSTGNVTHFFAVLSFGLLVLTKTPSNGGRKKR